ncbi:alcohol dehydrogenase catalytic domain-containing protein [Microvirga sp. ACRRW]|uniref:alcohol dehydrogenase catalytic domain-containing protein n=1 Tax=Microvirga sp. ACRRW TaxID=2918205 RepID=UPI001EF4D91B|nr:alcohol dehydrogenase catalytic domain-containing protein [Microvirga sp. ACRRW]MCG7394256.1 alcohol dehydrogenase catalytic domain-containing protein [Microvirga sp. ACRRW]
MQTLSRAEYTDLLVLAEPLACVIHAYKRLPPFLNPRTITIFGGGPIGVLHVIQVRSRFWNANIQVVEPDPARRILLERLLPFVSLHSSSQTIATSDLAVVATSDPEASMVSIETAGNAGTVILFSGINHKSRDELPNCEGHDLETIHRNEEVRTVSRNIRLVGSSGYHPGEIGEALALLAANPRIYKIVQTGIVEGIDGALIDSSSTSVPAIVQMIKDRELYQSHLKVVFRLDHPAQSDRRVIAGASRGSIELSEFDPIPVPAPGTARVRMKRFSVCETDRRVLRGTKSADLRPGLVLGHEGVGIVEAVGPNVSPSLLGSMCIILPHYFENSDEMELRGIGYLSRKMQHLGIHVDGVFTTQADLPVSCLYQVNTFATILAADAPDYTQINDAGHRRWVGASVA